MSSKEPLRASALSSTGATLVTGSLSALDVSVLSAITPSVRDAHQMAYDAESNRIVLFGGNSGVSRCALRDTWVYDVANNTWQDMSPSVAPPGRCCPGMTYDSTADRVILFGGAAAGVSYALNDTWAYDLNTNTWTEMTPAVSPPGRTGAQLAYIVRLERVILFGGHSIGGAQLGFNDTWTYDLSTNTWTRVTTNTPGSRPFPVMAYDAESDRVVVFGGMATEPYYPDNQTWMYDAANETWDQMTPAASPSPRFAAAAAYDVRADRVLVFGGGYEAGRNDTWAYDFNADTWSRIDTASKPSNRLTAMAYDAESDRTVLFGGSWPWGGVGEPVYNRETWVFDRENSTWTMVLGPLPPVAAFSFSANSPAPGDSLTFDASGSSDPDGAIAFLDWDFGDGGAMSGVRVNHTFVAAGMYAVTLTATDDDGLIGTATHSVTVSVQTNASPAGLASTEIAFIIGAVAAIAVGAAAVFLLRRKRKGPG